ncbi:E3 ubiquitin-protein ligase RKP-like [Aristolochia californica]|uniref:E3 ubiquitin-protein ligase RKP-like n=1 Tax=Aristolochia californica TaxID=171875 RepID=UPI0035DC6220
MAEDALKHSRFSSGLAVLLTNENNKENSQKNHLVSFCEDIGHQSLERTLEHIFDLPYKSIQQLTRPIDSSFVRSVLETVASKFPGNSDTFFCNRDGINVTKNASGPHTVVLDEASICGDIRIVQHPLLVESLALFSSARANTCVWKGKWMYEVILETSGIQQLGWATNSCPFTDRKGVGDAENSYAFDGRRVSKWNKEAEAYGQPWVVGDVIGCCINLDTDEILFYRNGVSLGVAFDKVRKMAPGFGYYPAISLSQGERCDINFGGHSFRYPIEGYCPLELLPSQNLSVVCLLQCFLRLLRLESMNRSDSTSIERLRRLKRFLPLEDLFHPISHGICEVFFSIIGSHLKNDEYFGWGPIASFLLEVFGLQAPHDYVSLDRTIDLFLEFPRSRPVLIHVIRALSSYCKTASLILMECPYSGSYPYLALVCHLLRREELITLWWRSSDFEFVMEGFLSKKGPNKQDLQSLIPTVWWPGSSEDLSSESSMILTTTALSGAINKIEEMHRELCLLVIQFIPPTSPPQVPGSVFWTFLQNLILKNRGADRSPPPPGVSNNSVLVSLYSVILHFLSEGFAVEEICAWMKCSKTKAGSDQGFLHRGGAQSFPLGLFLKADPHRADISRLGGSFSHLSKCYPVNGKEDEVVQWDESGIDDGDAKVTHSTRQKPCCCSTSDIDFGRFSKGPIQSITKGSRTHCNPVSERSSRLVAECSTGSLNDEIVDKPSTSDQSESDFGYRSMQNMRSLPSTSHFSSTTLREEELLDSMLLLYHLGLSGNFKQASYYMSHQSQSISLLEETDKQIRERTCGEQLKRLKDARNAYKEELIDCVRQCAWYRVTLFSRWKQRGMYAACMWIVQLLLVLSEQDSIFIYVPEFYLEALVDCFHALRRSDPPFVSSTIFIKQGLSSFVTFIITHFSDPRISSPELRDLLLQSISVLVHYKDYLVAFESNKAATERMPKALLSAFDNRSWIAVTNIILRLCKGSGFGSSKHGETSASIVFQGLLREACICDEELFSTFLNRLFNTLSWTMTEFSVSVREMQENYQVLDLLQRKCTVIFDLSCNLARVLEFCTREIPQAFLLGPMMNLQRLIELVVFILNHIISAADAEFFDMLARRQGQFPEKINRALILLPLVGIILNLMDASDGIPEQGEQNDIIGVFACMDCPATVQCGFQYLLDFNWGGVLKDASHTRLNQLERFWDRLRSRTDAEARREHSDDSAEEECICCICYACEVDARFEPCHHTSCFGCITRHLLNSQRCFFCNATVLEVARIEETYHGSPDKPSTITIDASLKTEAVASLSHLEDM